MANLRGARLAVLLCFILCAPSVLAATDAEQEAERVRLYNEAQALSASGKWDEARDLLARIVEIRSAPKALIALAYAELKLGHLLRARSLYSRARDDARTGGLKDDVAAAQLGMDHVAKRIPKLLLQLPEDIPAHQVRARLDGKPVIIRDGEIELDPGEHRLGVIALGRTPFKTELSVEESQRLEVSVSFSSADPESTPPPGADYGGTETEGDGPSPVGPLLVGGLGVVMASVGALMWRSGSAGYDDQAVRAKTCRPGAPCEDEIKARADDESAKIVNGHILLGVGATLAVGGLMWWILLPSKSSSDNAFAITPTPNGGFATFQSSF